MNEFFTHLDHVQLAMPKGKEEEARLFYVNLLGFVEIEKPIALQHRGGVWFKSGHIELHLGVEDHFIPAKKAHPALHVHHLETLIHHVKEQQIPYIEDKNLPFADRIYLHDPFGNRIEMIERHVK
ncbi:glyoxalase [Longirhabdus pacifica]|uniref:glyoxalase n=1 Tax=Longirhabdus pacifica TaxID=2305227 RepID=UPI001008E265|nr:glyoxalase [Longirhabdus pacifica]